MKLKRTLDFIPPSQVFAHLYPEGQGSFRTVGSLRLQNCFALNIAIAVSETIPCFIYDSQEEVMITLGQGHYVETSMSLRQFNDTALLGFKVILNVEGRFLHELHNPHSTLASSKGLQDGIRHHTPLMITSESKSRLDISGLPHVYLSISNTLEGFHRNQSPYVKCFLPSSNSFKVNMNLREAMREFNLTM